MSKNRPKGLKYKIKVKNTGWFEKGSKPYNTGTKGINKKTPGSFKKGQHPSSTTEFKKGMFPWNKDLKYNKISGNKHWNWKGGITTLVQQIRHCFEYRQWRSDVFTRDDYTCQECGARSGNGKAVYLEAHHYPKSFSDIFDEYKIRTLEQALDCEELWNINNGQTLCLKCHNKTKHGKPKTK